MTNKNLFLDLNLKLKTPAAARRSRIAWTERTRHITQFGFAGLILYLSVVHNTTTTDGTTASIDALCPFGAIETFGDTYRVAVNSSRKHTYQI